ncbi:mismatched base pair and cruciform DNA recognition protein [Coprinellus micaceus]|uniref:Mismatched base pair and cruciform DNA recognition protein n=1 Tax=Coprinellus micaceus TaxID=71717 RepID=A0A4Y7TJC1_COPMI|nr:mismatched base pair and cruciform DNA recognition protein [Coprinellus micaceus]
MPSSASNTFSGEPSKVNGQFHSVKGTVVESIGNVTGATSWVDSGKQEHAAGEAEYNAAQAKAWAEGVSDRVEGKKDAIIGAETKGNIQHDKGAAQQNLNKFLKQTRDCDTSPPYTRVII